MAEFLYQIKGKLGQPDSGWFGTTNNWSFPPIWTDKVEAKDRNEAKIIIEELYGKKFPTRVLAKDLDSNEFLLTLKEIKEDDTHTKSLFEVKECLQCKANFKIIEKYQLGTKGGGGLFCSSECSKEHSDLEAIKRFDSDVFNGKTHPIIYKITNKENGMCYIGKTTQIFTLRWYHHFFQRTNSKFHQAIGESPLTSWNFEILEVLIIPKELNDYTEVNRFILSKETEYIKKYDSVANGYNSLISLTEGEKEVTENQESIDFGKEYIDEINS